MTEKRCARCGLVKPIVAFHRQASQTGGRRPECKECRKVDSRDYHRRNAVQIRGKVKKWRQQNPERAKATNMAWIEKHRDHKRSLDRDRYRRKFREIQAYYRTPERRAYARVNAKNQKARRKAQMNATVEHISVAEWESLKAEYLGLCVYCHRRPRSLTMDHVVPLDAGGSHTKDNIIPACGRCNREKATRSLVVYLIARHRAVA